MKTSLNDSWVSPFRRTACAAGLALTLLSPWPAFSQTSDAFTASQVGDVPPQSQDEGTLSELNPEVVVAVFQQACVLNNGQSSAVVDWALTRNFTPTDPLRGSLDGMIDGESGNVFVAPSTDGRVLLAITGSQCAVWAERTAGPPLRAAMAAYVGNLSGRGAKTQLVLDRSLQRSGAWRNQMQWRYRAAGASQDLGLGVVTTLTEGRGTQVLMMSPMARPTPYTPDGVPR